jgi:chromosomal replication initiation ATPase DnaA
MIIDVFEFRKKVCGCLLVKEVDFLSKSRKPDFVDARDFYVKILLDYGFDERIIAKAINRDRTTIYASMERFNNRFEVEKAYRNKFNIIKNIVENEYSFKNS